MRFRSAVLLMALGACASATTPWAAAELRSAEDAPTSFVTEDGALPARGCRNPLIDPRDRTRLRLVRSARVGAGELGDYEVPAGRYGVAPGELLRIDCATGEPLGIVRN